MFWKSSIVAAGLWAAAMPAQTAPPDISANLQPLARAKADAAARALMKQLNPTGSAVCSIPLREVPVKKDVDAMPQLLPPAGPDGPDPFDRMPFVKLPAPPCQEEKR